MCNSGLTITNEMNGQVEFSYTETEQCKVHVSCETVTVTQYEKSTMQTSKPRILSIFEIRI